MDGFIDLAKRGLDAYQRSQAHVDSTGGEDYNGPHSQQGRGSSPDFDHDEAVRHASSTGTGDPSLFSAAMNYVSQNRAAHSQPVDEQHALDAHDQAYAQAAPGSLSANSMGAAAALQILKKFTSSGGGGGHSQTQLVSMAMAEASKLFDSAGGAAAGNKQDAVNGAAMTITKLLVQSKFSGGTIGGGNSGGLSSLMGLASKFM